MSASCSSWWWPAVHPRVRSKPVLTAALPVVRENEALEIVDLRDACLHQTLPRKVPPMILSGSMITRCRVNVIDLVMLAGVDQGQELRIILSVVEALAAVLSAPSPRSPVANVLVEQVKGQRVHFEPAAMQIPALSAAPSENGMNVIAPPSCRHIRTDANPVGSTDNGVGHQVVLAVRVHSEACILLREVEATFITTL